MFFNTFLALCNDKGVKPGRVADEMGISRGTVTSWKKAGYTPRAEQLTKIAEYFNVPIDFLLQRPPFDCWDLISQNWAGFFHYVDMEPEAIKRTWGIDCEALDQVPLHHLVSFLSEAVETVRPTEEGDWEIRLRPTQENKKAPTPEDERKVSDQELMFALWGDTDEVDLADLDDVKRYAEFIRGRKRGQ